MKLEEIKSRLLALEKTELGKRRVIIAWCYSKAVTHFLRQFTDDKWKRILAVEAKARRYKVYERTLAYTNNSFPWTCKSWLKGN